MEERAYNRRYQSIRGYDALIRSLPKDGASSLPEDDPDLELDIRKSLAARVSEPVIKAWVFDDQEQASSETYSRKESPSVDISCRLEHGRDEIPSFEQIDRGAGPRLHEWSSIHHVDLIHRQGLHAPAVLLEYVDGKRPYYKASYNESKNDRIPFLYLRQKRNRLKFRTSCDESLMCKFRNPKYAGKCTVKVCDAERMICIVSSEARQPVGIISISSKSGKHHVRVELTGQYLNWQESGSEGLVMSGNINNYVDPILILRIEQSSRAVLEIRRSGPLIPASNEAYEHPPHMMVYLDYPLTLFLSSVISVMVDARRRGIGSNK